MNKQREAHIRAACRRNGCDQEMADRHRAIYIRSGWDSHPPEQFQRWFMPTGIDDVSGASVGGLPDAERIWARHDPGGWVQKQYGMTAEVAWNTKHLREQFLGWQEAGCPEHDEPFVSLALPLDEQAKRFGAISKTLRAAVAPIPKATAKELAAEARRLGQPTKPIEPLDEVEPIPF
jgi:hypothetical protein